MIAIAGWAVLHLVLGVAAPWLVQRYVVAPAEAARELPYLAHNLDATRAAFRLDAVDQVETPLTDGLGGDATAAAALAGDLSRIPLFDTDAAPRRAAGPRGHDGDPDHRRRPRPLRDRRRDPARDASPPRNASRDDLPEQGWVQHAPRLHPRRRSGHRRRPTSPTPDGRPDVDALADELVPERPELYFGEGLADWYAIVGTKRVEQGGAPFDADTGIPLSLAVSTGGARPQ